MEWWMWLIIGIVIWSVFIGSSEEKKKEEEKKKADEEIEARKNAYSEIVPELLALCVSVNEQVNDEHVTLAKEMIGEDELITDKPSAFESLTNNILIMGESRKKSISILKLKATTVISKSTKINNPLQNTRIMVMLEGMKDLMAADADKKSLELIDEIIAAFEVNGERGTRVIPSEPVSSGHGKPTENVPIEPNNRGSKSSALKYAAMAAGGAVVGSSIANANEVDPSFDADVPDGYMGNDDTVADSAGEMECDSDVDLSDEDGGSMFDIFSDD
jgi:hypothetical protein